MFKYSSVPAYSMGPKTHNNNDQGFPGPGTYEGEGAINKTSPHPNDPRWGFSKNPRDIKYGNANPGPGQYDSPDRARVQGGYVGARPNDMARSNVPGPGAYDGNSANWKQAKAPAYTMRAKGSGNKGDAVPGPGQYDPDAIRYEHKSYSGKMVSKAARDHMYKTGTPGPGGYDPNSNIFNKAQGKFGRESRDGWKNNGNPGPGSYDQKGSFAKKGYSYGKQPRDWMSSTHTPGPGTYDYNASSMGGPGWKVGKEARDGWRTNANPGPGNYDVGGKFDKKNGKINPEGRTGTGFNNPGPGTYDGDFTVGRDRNPQFSFGKGDKLANDQGFPGPGTYDGHGVDTRASIAMDQGPKGLRYGNAYPGPGTYGPEGSGLGSYPKWSFGKDPRDHEKDRIKVGPADYDIPHSIPDVATYNYPDKMKRKIHL